MLILSHCISLKNQRLKMKNLSSLEEDSLVNYSYLINGEENGEPHSSGTGFFIKYENKFYLVTNYHVLTGIDPFKNKYTDGKKNMNTSTFIVFRPVDKALSILPNEISFI